MKCRVRQRAIDGVEHAGAARRHGWEQFQLLEAVFTRSHHFGMPQLQAADDSGIGAGADLRLLLGKDAAASLRAPDVRLASNLAP